PARTTYLLWWLFIIDEMEQNVLILVDPPGVGAGAPHRRDPRLLTVNRGVSFMAGTDKASLPSSPARYASEYVPLLEGSPAMREIRTLIESVADTDATVL